MCGAATPDESGTRGRRCRSARMLAFAPSISQRHDHRRSRRDAGRSAAGGAPTPGCCFRCRSHPKAAARSAATCRRTPAAPPCSATATRAISCSASRSCWPTARTGCAARPAQGQHRLRSQATVHRQRRHARHRHRRRAEAVCGAAHARDRARGDADGGAAPSSSCVRRSERSATGWSGSSSSADLRCVCRASTIRRSPIRCPDHDWYVLLQADDSAAALTARSAGRRRVRAGRRNRARSSTRRSRSRRSRPTGCGRCARTSARRSAAKDRTSSTTFRCPSPRSRPSSTMRACAAQPRFRARGSSYSATSATATCTSSRGAGGRRRRRHSSPTRAAREPDRA